MTGRSLADDAVKRLDEEGQGVQDSLGRHNEVFCPGTSSVRTIWWDWVDSTRSSLSRRWRQRRPGSAVRAWRRTVTEPAASNWDRVTKPEETCLLSAAAAARLTPSSSLTHPPVLLTFRRLRDVTCPRQWLLNEIVHTTYKHVSQSSD